MSRLETILVETCLATGVIPYISFKALLFGNFSDEFIDWYISHREQVADV